LACLRLSPAQNHTAMVWASLLVFALLTSSATGLPTVQSPPPPQPPFECPPLVPSPSVPENVHQLRFADVRVSMALGDSMTAAFAAKSHFVLDGLREYRGLAYCTGGDEGEYTIPNFLEHTTGRRLPGVSVGESIPFDAIEWNKHIIRPHNPPKDHLDAAQSQAKVQDVLRDQVDYLVQQLNATEGIDFNNDWKMLTILIGANNAGGSCRNTSYSHPDYYEDQLRQVLDKVHADIPRVWVNLLTMFNVSQLWDRVWSKDVYCRDFHEVFKTEFGCVNTGEAGRKILDETLMEYNVRMRSIAQDWATKNLTEFHVQVQPALEDMVVLDRMFVSELDCLHPSNYAHAAWAIALWNNLQQAPGSKTKTLDWDMKIMCPTNDTLIQ